MVRGGHDADPEVISGAKPRFVGGGKWNQWLGIVPRNQVDRHGARRLEI